MTVLLKILKIDCEELPYFFLRPPELENKCTGEEMEQSTCTIQLFGQAYTEQNPLALLAPLWLPLRDIDVPVSGSLEVGKGVERKTEARPTDGEDSTSSYVASYTTHSAPYLILTAVFDCICNSCVMHCM